MNQPFASTPPSAIDTDLPAALREAQTTIATLRTELGATRQTLATLELAVRGANDGIWNWDLRTNEAYISPRWKAILGYEDHELANHLDTHARVLHPDDAPGAFAAVQANIDHGHPYAVEVRMQHKDGTYRWVYTRGDTMRDADGTPLYMAGALTDITARKQAEEAMLRAAEQDRVIAMQAAILAEVSTPVIPLTDQILVMPLVGTIDSRRAQQVVEALLEQIMVQRATTAILDITGVRVVDTAVANALIHASQAARLLGTQVILTGIRPEVAQTMVGLGIDLQGMQTHSSLQHGIAHVLQRSLR